MSLLVFHFNNPDDSAKSQQVSNLPEVLVDIFGKDRITDFEFGERLVSLTDLYSLQSCSKFALLEKVRESVVEILHHYCGMGTYQFQSRDNDEVFCKVQFSEEVLLSEAESSRYLLQMSSSLEQNEVVSKTMPYIPYVSSNADIYQKHGESVLRDIDRIRLMEQIIRAHVKIEGLLKHGVLVDLYPLHNVQEMEALRKELVGWDLRPLPVDGLRNYVGEKLALYFLWLEFYAQQLFSLGLLGVGLWVYGKVAHTTEGHTSTYQWLELAFAIITCVWCAMFQIKWERKSNFLALKFGTRNFKSKEFEREQFVGEMVQNPITCEHEKVFDNKIKLKRQITTYLTTFFLIGLVVALTLSLFIYRAILMQGGERGWGPMVIAIFNSLQIYIMNLVYDSLALKLNDWENHKTQTAYENGLIVKKVGYQFVNYFISLFYVAFIKEHWDGCDQGNCMAELNYNLWVMFALNMVFNVIEIGSPVISARSKWNAEETKVKKMFDEGKAARLEMSQTEKEGKLEILVILNEYLEVVMNFGYIIFFCVAFPLGPIIYWVFNILEIKGDAFKLFTLFKRPFPRQADSIGVWADIMSFLSIIGVMTNTGLMIFTANIFNLPITQRWAVFVVIEHILMFLMVMILNYYPKNFPVTEDLEKRHEALRNKYFYGSVGITGSKKAYHMSFTIDPQINFSDN